MSQFQRSQRLFFTQSFNYLLLFFFLLHLSFTENRAIIRVHVRLETLRTGRKMLSQAITCGCQHRYPATAVMLAIATARWVLLFLWKTLVISGSYLCMRKILQLPWSWERWKTIRSESCVRFSAFGGTTSNFKSKSSTFARHETI